MAELSPTYEELAARVAELEVAADRSTDDELTHALLRIAELEAAEERTKWALERLASIDDPLEKLLVGIWEQMRLSGLADQWGRFATQESGLVSVVHSGPLRPDLDPAQNEVLRRLQREPYPYDSMSIAGAAYLTDAPVAVADIQGEDGLAYPATRSRVMRIWSEIGSTYHGHSALAAPLRFAGERIGVLLVLREEIRPFTPEDIELTQGYADQMALAIGNAQIAEQLEERNRERAESLEQQTAMAQVLSVIAKSPTDVEPVLRDLASRVAGLLGALGAGVVWWNGVNESYQVLSNPPPGWKGPDGRIAQSRSDCLERRILINEATRQRLPVQDWGTTREFRERWPDNSGSDSPDDTPISMLAVPLILGADPIGAIYVWRYLAEQFSDKQIAVLQTFADQAVIAIENARLFNELQESNAGLATSLERQTGMASVLRVISQSPTDLDKALNELCKTAATLMRGNLGTIQVPEASGIRTVGWSLAPGVTPASRSRMGPIIVPFDSSSLGGKVMNEGRPLTFSGNGSELVREFPNAFPQGADIDDGRFVSLARVPLLRDGPGTGGAWGQPYRLRRGLLCG